MGTRQRTVATVATTPQSSDLNRIAAFVQVMEAGSFTAAARLMGQPKSSLSRAVSKLEHELGVVLLQRTTRKLAITEAGQRFLESARSAIGMLAEARAQLLDDDVQPRGMVRFTAPHDDGEAMTASALAEFAHSYPGIHVDCMFTQRKVDLLAEGVDLALRAGRIDETLAGRKLGDSPLGLYASPGYLATHGTPRTLAQLSAHECVLFRGGRGRARWTLEGKRGRETVEVRGRISVDEVAAACQLAVRGVGIGLLPVMLARRWLDKNELVRVLPALKTAGDAAYLVHPATRHLPHRVALLRDHLFARLRPMFEACTEHL